ncbi:immunoglobulin i-set domain-containing protein [Phthorimaea operculella]|nr:immunoglobulin i-set domain-containing protein [Phthorimaea operculella]
MKLAILIAVASLASCQASNINRHNVNNLYSDISNQIGTEQIPSTKHNRNFVTLTSRPDEKVVLKPGATLKLTCEGIGFPAPNIHWFKNNIPVYEFDHESNEITNPNPNSLARITSTLLVTGCRNRDEYTCVLSSKAKAVRATTVVQSEEAATTDTDNLEYTKHIREPHILTSYKSYIDTIGNRVVLPCKARGHPRPKIVWKNQKGEAIKNNEKMQVLRSGKLVFSSLSWSDMGEYTCVATNAYGSRNVTTFVYPAKAG